MPQLRAIKHYFLLVLSLIFTLSLSNINHSLLAQEQLQELEGTLPFKERITITGKAYRGVQTSADVSIALAKGQTAITKPLIIVEGFNPRLSVDKPYGNWYAELMNKDFELVRLHQEEGYDIIYVDWEDSETYIQANAMTLIEVLRWINQHKKLGSYPNVLIAHSMGGLVCRYALKKMEVNGQRHDVACFVSYDTPHLGANVPIAYQYAFDGIKRFFSEHKNLDYLKGKTSKLQDLIKLGDRLTQCHSFKQMVINSLDREGHRDNREHRAWQEELSELGFPQGDKGQAMLLLAISNGCLDRREMSSHYLKADISSRTKLGTDILGLAGLNLFYASGLGIALEDLTVGLMTLLPGENGFHTKLLLAPSKFKGDLLTDIDIDYEKKILWCIPYKKKIFKYQRYAEDSWQLDYCPSSFYKDRNMDQLTGVVGRELPLIAGYKGEIEIDSKLSFIPTLSALAIGTGLNPSLASFHNLNNLDKGPFKQNYFIHRGDTTHAFMTTTALLWAEAKIDSVLTDSQSKTIHQVKEPYYVQARVHKIDTSKYAFSRVGGMIRGGSTTINQAELNGKKYAQRLVSTWGYQAKSPSLYRVKRGDKDYYRMELNLEHSQEEKACDEKKLPAYKLRMVFTSQKEMTVGQKFVIVGTRDIIPKPQAEQINSYIDYIEAHQSKLYLLGNAGIVYISPQTKGTKPMEMLGTLKLLAKSINNNQEIVYEFDYNFSSLDKQICTINGRFSAVVQDL